MSTSVRVRFAPAPTGLLHIGNARTALFNYIFAKRHQGTFILRIEDTDVERSSEASLDQILEDLRWLGIEWDEGPDKEGPDGPYRQSQRSSLYLHYSEQMLREGKAYKCFCSNERLERLREEQLQKGLMPRYDGRCRTLCREMILKMEEEGQKPVLRFRVGRGPIQFQDLVHGKMKFQSEGIGDFIILRSDRTAAYNFACVIDDHHMHVSHVIRGEDHLSNTPRQILIYQALGWQPPLFAHHPLILGPDRSPLSKRHGATAVSQYREEGFLPEAIQNYLLLLGWSHPSGEEVLPLKEIIKAFSFENISKSAPIFHRKKLEWLNGIYLRHCEEDRFVHLLLPFIEKAGISLDQIDQNYMSQISKVLKENLTLLSQVEQYLGIFFDEKFSFEDEAKTLLKGSKHRELIQGMLDLLISTPPFEPEAWPSFLNQIEKRLGVERKDFYAPLRAAVTGRMRGPELVKMLPILGKERIIRRLEMALQIS